MVLPFPASSSDDKPDDPIAKSRPQWLAQMRTDWLQGQHIAIMGRTGRGKTTLARDLLRIRDWSVVLAIKRADDTLETFPQAGYKKITKWPPDYGVQHCVLWAKPRNLYDLERQRILIASVLSDVYKNGGWSVLFDDVARLASARAFGFKNEIATMLSESRSSHSSIVSAMTQPSSVTATIPSEVWRQVRYHLVFYYRVGRDLDVISDIVGYNKPTVKRWMSFLGPYDFLAFDDLTDTVTLVRS